MNWDAIGAIGEIVGALAVVVTLFYLATQIRQNARYTLASIREQRTASSQQTAFKWIDESALLVKVMADEPLDAEELAKAHLFFRAAYRGWESYVHQHEDGLFDDAAWQGVRATIERFHRLPAVQRFWVEHRYEFSGRLQTVIDELTGRDTDAA